MAGFKFYEPLLFRPPETADLVHISKWISKATGQNAIWQQQFHELVLWEWRQFGLLASQFAWMGITGRRRLFFLELAGPNDLYITVSPKLLKKPLLITLYLHDVARHLHIHGIRSHIKVNIHGLDTTYYLHLSQSGAFLQIIVPSRRENGEKEHTSLEPQ